MKMSTMTFDQSFLTAVAVSSTLMTLAGAWIVRVLIQIEKSKVVALSSVLEDDGTTAGDLEFEESTSDPTKTKELEVEKADGSGSGSGGAIEMSPMGSSRASTAEKQPSSPTAGSKPMTARKARQKQRRIAPIFVGIQVGSVCVLVLLTYLIMVMSNSPIFLRILGSLCVFGVFLRYQIGDEIRRQRVDRIMLLLSLFLFIASMLSTLVYCMKELSHGEIYEGPARIVGYDLEQYNNTKHDPTTRTDIAVSWGKDWGCPLSGGKVCQARIQGAMCQSHPEKEQTKHKPHYDNSRRRGRRRRGRVLKDDSTEETQKEEEEELEQAEEKEEETEEEEEDLELDLEDEEMSNEDLEDENKSLEDENAELQKEIEELKQENEIEDEENDSLVDEENTELDEIADEYNEDIMIVEEEEYEDAQAYEDAEIEGEEAILEGEEEETTDDEAKEEIEETIEEDEEYEDEVDEAYEEDEEMIDEFADEYGEDAEEQYSEFTNEQDTTEALAEEEEEVKEEVEETEETEEEIDEKGSSSSKGNGSTDDVYEEFGEEFEEEEEEEIEEEYEEEVYGDDEWYWDEYPSNYDDDYFEDEYWDYDWDSVWGDYACEDLFDADIGGKTYDVNTPAGGDDEWPFVNIYGSCKTCEAYVLDYFAEEAFEATQEYEQQAIVYLAGAMAGFVWTLLSYIQYRVLPTSENEIELLGSDGGVMA